MSDDNNLSKNDLFILMESYKNNIQLNTTLLEQQKQLMVMTNDNLTRQKELCESLGKFIDRLATCSETVTSNHNKLITAVQTHDNNVSKDFSSIKFRLHLAFVGMGTIIISLIGLAYNYADKFLTLKDLIMKGH